MLHWPDPDYSPAFSLVSPFLRDSKPLALTLKNLGLEFGKLLL
jgi:hypothetical protein